MTNNAVTIPKRGDLVSTAQGAGVFEVANINSLMQTASLKSTDGNGHVTPNVPWTTLTYVHKK